MGSGDERELRDAAELRAVRDAATTELNALGPGQWALHDDPRPYLQGVADALEWILGTREHAPISGRRLDWSDPRILGRESMAARDAIEGLNYVDQYHDQYALGVRKAVLWSWAREVPSPLEDPERYET